MKNSNYIKILNEQMVIALGCTEPIAIAFAAALATKYVKGKKVSNIKVIASGNVIKNAMAVEIPGANGCGINLAASLGVLSKDAGLRLEVLSGLSKDDVEKAKKMVRNGGVDIEVSELPKRLYIEVIVQTEKSKSRVIIEDNHTNVVLIEVDGEKIENVFQDKKDLQEMTMNEDLLKLDGIWEFVNNADINELEIIHESIKLNTEISREGLRNSYGMQVGRIIQKNIDKGLLADDVSTYAMALTAAGSDARMAGGMMPVISNSGSGNQGILATVPVIAVAEKLSSDNEKLVRAVLLSNLVTIHIKLKFGVLSALCGATIASIGASCGITYLLGGNINEVKSAIQNTLGNITGMLCDGAKPGCALKVATCTSAAVQSALLAMEGIVIKSTEGIIEDDPEKTIENLCKLGNQGTVEVDKLILDIMLKKGKC